MDSNGNASGGFQVLKPILFSYVDFRKYSDSIFTIIILIFVFSSIFLGIWLGCMIYVNEINNSIINKVDSPIQHKYKEYSTILHNFQTEV